jgi:ATP-dependent Clp protease ATP-binding subunit ClpB
MRKHVMDALRGQFRPEFLNRIDEIVIFHGLAEQQIESIVELETKALAKRLEERKIHLELTPAAKALIAKEGYDPVYGARPLKRTIQKLILDPLAQKVLAGQYKEGDTVSVDVEDGQIQFWTEEFADEKAKARKKRGQQVGALN